MARTAIAIERAAYRGDPTATGNQSTSTVRDAATVQIQSMATVADATPHRGDAALDALSSDVLPRHGPHEAPVHDVLA
jgi:hypothetical protein